MDCLGLDSMRNVHDTHQRRQSCHGSDFGKTFEQSAFVQRAGKPRNHQQTSQKSKISKIGQIFL